MAKRNNSKSGSTGSSGKSGGKTPKSSSKGIANTSAYPYLDTFDKAKVCEEDRKRVEERCKDTDANKKESQDNVKRSSPQSKTSALRQLGNITGHIKQGLQKMDDAAKTAYGYKRNADNSWVEDHCQHLWVKPTSTENINKFIKELEDTKKKLEEGIGAVLKQAGGTIVDKAKDAAINYAEKAAVREAASATSLVVPVAGEVIVAGMTLFNIADGIWTAGKTAVQAVGKAKEAYDNIKGIRDQIGKLDDLINKKLSPTELWADTMTALAYTNRCLQARRCKLVPYGKSKDAGPQARSGQACCPGQTGHHLLPEEMFQDCPAYTKEKHNAAPTVCAEGANHSHGSHGLLHGSMEELMQKHRQANPGKDSITQDEAIKAGVKSHNQVFKPACSAKCLTAQLESYYKDLCKDKMKPRGGKGKSIENNTTGNKTSDI